MYDLEPARTGHRGRPAKHGKRLSVETDFTFSNEKIGDYYTGVRRVLTRIFGTREVLAYVTAAEKEHGTKRLFFSTVFPEDLQIFCAWQEKAPLNQTGSDRMKLKRATMSRKHSGLFAAIWCEAAKGLRCWLT